MVAENKDTEVPGVPLDADQERRVRSVVDWATGKPQSTQKVAVGNSAAPVTDAEEAAHMLYVRDLFRRKFPRQVYDVGVNRMTTVIRNEMVRSGIGSGPALGRVFVAMIEEGRSFGWFAWAICAFVEMDERGLG